jgi:hypothetical protein
MQDTIWVTKDGRHIWVRQMERSHLLNCIDKIQRSRRQWRKEYLLRLLLEIQIRNHLGEER